VTPLAPVPARLGRKKAKRVFRIATLFVPSWLAWYAAFSESHPSALTNAVKLTLGPLWVLLMAILVVRTSVAAFSRRKDGSSSLFAQIDILTANGSALAWVSSFAIIGAVVFGWASLATVGLLGSGVFHCVVLFTLLVVRGADPMRAASIVRRFSPERPTEGDDVIEEVQFTGTRIPIGFRLFASGRIGQRWALSRYVLDAGDSGNDVVLESELGPAIRGEHDSEPFHVWLQDTFGICRSLQVAVKTPRLTVLPRTRKVAKAIPLFDLGDGSREARPASRLPTEGLFKMREYQPGDDVRRIHWVRSLASRELIVRLPDEIPPDRPNVRVVLDTYFPEAFAVTCNAPNELLDSMISVWLATGRALAEAGARVSMVVALPEGEGIAIAKQDLSLRNHGPAIALGARVTWQNRMMVDELFTDEATYVISRAVVARGPLAPKIRFILVMPTVSEPRWPYIAGARLPFPMGTPDNRYALRKELSDKLARERADHARALLAMRVNFMEPPPGSFTAFCGDDGIRLEALK